MIKIIKLRLKNFKSFKSAELPFAEGFTAIAGSNGSGKSNIFDAILFVLGITSMKLLRASRLSDLVNSTATENYGKVDILLKDDEKIYEISRMIDRQGKSVFRLNEEKKTLDEITSLLEELGIKPKGHNFVVQGDITKIIEMSPEERRKIIDDVAGLQEFDEKKAEALGELDKVDGRIKEASIVLREREKYLEGLEKERSSAMQYDNLVSEKKKSKATILFHEISKINSEMEKISSRKSTIFSEKQEKETKSSEMQKEQNELREKVLELDQRILQSSEQTYAGIGMQIESKKSGKELVLEKINSKKETLDKNNAKINSLSHKAEQLKQELSAGEKDFVELSQKMPELGKNLEKLKKEKTELEFKAKENKLKENNLKEELKGIELQINNSKEKYFSKSAQIEEAKKSSEFKRLFLEETVGEKSSLEKKIDEKKAKEKILNELLKKNPNPQRELNEIEIEHEMAIGELKELHAGTKIFHEAMAELRKEISSCPICDHPLTIKTKTELLSKKESGLNELKSKIQKIEEKIGQISEKKHDLKKIIETKYEMEKHLHGIGELLQKNDFLSRKISELKESLNINIEREKNELNELKKGVEELEAKHQRIRADILGVSESAFLKKVSELSEQINSLEMEKGIFDEKNRNKSGFESKSKKSIEEIEAETASLAKENKGLEKENSEKEQTIKRLEKEIMDLEIELHKSEKATKKLIEEKNSLNEKTNSLTEKILQFQQSIKSLEQQENDLNIEKSKLEVRLMDLSEEFKDFETVERFREYDSKNLQKRIFEIDKKIAELGAINMKALEAYDSLSAEVNELNGKAQKLEEERLAVLEMIQKIEIKRTNVFMECFNEINKNFNRTFDYLFEGEGLLSLSNNENPLDAGLLIEAKHKAGEKMKNIDAMSGGEKSLTALAFIFAIQMYEPSPFYVFDEADAALDQTNTEKLANLIKEISKQSQFIGITHNSLLIKKADQLIGVALNEQKSSVIGLKLKEKIAEDHAV